MLTNEQLQAIGGLVGRFEGLSEPQRRAYSEADTRSDFIDPLFAALGWPMGDREYVERETTVIEGKRPDYIFKIAGVPRFFLEAKPFREDIYDQEETRKAITKAYSKGVPWVGITNFQRFVLYDAQEELTAALPRRVFDLSYRDYLDTQAEAGLHLLTPQALQDRALEEYAQRIGARRRAVPIEKRLYESMRDWREKLFNAMAHYFNWRSDEELRQGDEAIQRLIDRLIFLRNCEDRGIGGTDLRGLRNRIRARDRNVRVTESLLRLFAQAATTYDSELFETHAVIDRHLRRVGTNLDDLLGDIVLGLYAVPRSFAEYDFSQMEPDVLGEVYEQYLGYVPQRVRQLAAQRPLPGMPAPEITVEAKRQRRKERGIYYTPRWVVQYIVQQTLGRFLEENRHRPDAIDNLTILDPACGSGSFLIRAYETLLEYHAAQMGGDIGHLDTKIRESILRRNIFGVDLDPQAVEIARLNLLIRMVRQQELLPELKDNIRHGNSLIQGGEAELRPYFGDGWEEKHPFNWQREFPDIMARGGFDIIIGNPPYVETSLIPPGERDYYRDHFESAHDLFDLYVLFTEAGLKLLKAGGRLGFITSGRFLKSDYGQKLCTLLHRETAIENLVDLSAQKEVFGKAINYPVIIAFRKGAHTRTFCFLNVPAAPSIQDTAALNTLVDRLGYDVRQEALLEGRWPPPRGIASGLVGKLASKPKLLDIADLYHGLQTNADPVFILEHRGDSRDELVKVFSHATNRQHELEGSLLHPVLKGSVHMRRYRVAPTDLLLLFPYYPASANLLPPQVMQSDYRQTWEYLNLPAVKERLESREGGRWRGHPQWYGYSYRKNHNKFATGKPRLMTPSIAPVASFSYDADGRYHFIGSGGGGGGGYGIELKPSIRCSYLYLLGLLNSKTLDYYLHTVSSPFRGGYWAYNRQYIAQLPIRLPDVDKPAEKTVHDQLVALVQRMLDLHQRLAAKGEVRDSEREAIEREIAQTDRQIDDLVYDLYGLTAAERALIESEVHR